MDELSVALIFLCFAALYFNLLPVSIQVYLKDYKSLKSNCFIIFMIQH